MGIKYKLLRKYRRLKRHPVYNTIEYYAKALYEKSEKDHVWVLSSAVAFNVMICVIPFILILLTVLGIYLDTSNTLERLSDYLNNLIPLPAEYKGKFISNLLERVKELTANTFVSGAIGLGGLIWTMSGLFGTMRDVINKIYNVEEELNYFLGKLRDILLVFGTLILFVLSMSMTSLIQVIQIYSQGLIGEDLSLNVFQKFAPIMLTFFVSVVLFYILYRYVPHIKLPRKAIILSSILAGVLFEVLKYLFTLYLLKMSNFGKIYGAYAAIVITIFWIYYISVIFVFGAEFGYIYIQRNNLKTALEKGVKKKKNGTEKAI